MADTDTKDKAADEPAVNEAPEKQEPEVQVKKVKQPRRLMHSEHAKQVWCHMAEAGEEPEMFLKPETWAHVARVLQPDHEIIVTAQEQTWRLHLYVRAAGRVEAHVAKISLNRFGGEVNVSGDDVPYETKWRGPHAKWSVVKKKDGAVAKDQFPTQEAAQGWITGHMQALEA